MNATDGVKIYESRPWAVFRTSQPVHWHASCKASVVKGEGVPFGHIFAAKDAAMQERVRAK